MLLATNPICRWFLLLIRMRRIWCSIGFGLLMIHRSTQNTVHYDLLLSLTMKRPSRCPSMNRLLVKRNHKSRYNDKLRTLWPIFIDLPWCLLLFFILIFVYLPWPFIVLFFSLYWFSLNSIDPLDLFISLSILTRLYWSIFIFTDIYWSLLIFIDL